MIGLFFFEWACVLSTVSTALHNEREREVLVYIPYGFSLKYALSTKVGFPALRAEKFPQKDRARAIFWEGGF